jgi:hypothetical protein
MPADNTSLTAAVCLALILACAICCAGCIVPSLPATTTPVPTTAVQTMIPTPVTAILTPTPGTPEPTLTADTTPALKTATLSDGVTITYPSDWEKEELSELALRDYGRTTTNIANFYSPDITQERKDSDGPNPDASTYSSLSIDVDPSPVTDFEQYFNLVTIALQNSYGAITITKHNYQLKVSPSDTFEGYKSYQMDFDTKTMRASYVFTNVDGTIYIFAFKNPSPYSVEVQDMVKSIVISPAGASKHR